MRVLPSLEINNTHSRLQEHNGMTEGKWFVIFARILFSIHIDISLDLIGTSYQLPYRSFSSTFLYVFHLRLVLFLLTLCICVEWIPIKENIPNQGAMKFRWINMITFHFIKRHWSLYGYLKYRLIKKSKSNRPEVFCRKGVLTNFSSIYSNTIYHKIEKTSRK